MKSDEIDEIARRRLAELPRSDGSDDLFWTTTFKPWAERDSAALLLEFARLAKRGERVPAPLLEWVAEAIEASMVKPPDHRGSELLIELGLKSRGGRPPARLPKPRVLAQESKGLTMRALAAQYGVSSATIDAHLKKAKPTPAEAAALLEGLALLDEQLLKLLKR